MYRLMTSTTTATTRRRVVVTGLGAVTPLGLNMVDSWRTLLANDASGLTDLTAALHEQSAFLTEAQLEHELALAQQLQCQVAAPVRGFACVDNSNKKTPRFVQMALRAAQEALAQAGLLVNDNDSTNTTTTTTTTTLSPERIGVSIGSGMSGVREIAHAVLQTESNKGSFRRLSPHFVPKVLGNSASGRVALQYQLKGPNLCAATACAAGSHAIGEAARCIAVSAGQGRGGGGVDVMLAGGAEACVDPWSLAGFGRLRALSTRFNDAPHAASRPFDAQRDGFVMGEGAAVLVLEELEHALRRLEKLNNNNNNNTATPTHLVELIGYGATGDAHHITAPDPDGDGAVRAMQMALQDAQPLLELDDDHDNNNNRVQYVNAHATSTPKGDEIEARAIHEALCATKPGQDDGNNNEVWVSSTKGHTGHLLGAAGAVEAAFTVQSLLDQCLPATANLQDDSGDERNLPGLRHVRGPALRMDDDNDYCNLALSNSFGFGGTNSSLLFRRIKL